jgi:hypothetical protein
MFSDVGTKKNRIEDGFGFNFAMGVLLIELVLHLN